MERLVSGEPNLLTTSTNRHLLQPTRHQRKRRRRDIKDGILKGKGASTAGSEEQGSAIAAKLNLKRSGSGSPQSRNSQLIDLVVEDTDAEEVERVRARKEGGAAWNRDEQKHFVRTYGDEDLGEDIREGFDPAAVKAADEPPLFAIGEEAKEDAPAERSTVQAATDGEPNPWDTPGRNS